MTTAVERANARALPRPPLVVEGARRGIIPFTLGTHAYDDGRPVDANVYDPASPEGVRWTEGWNACRRVREGEADAVAAEVGTYVTFAEDAAGEYGCEDLGLGELREHFCQDPTRW